MGMIIRDLWFSYPGQPVLREVNLDIREGVFAVILGKNGSGKSTLLKLIAGMLTPERGRIEVLGKNVAKLSMGERAKLIGYLSQFHQPVFPFTAEEVVLTGRASYVFSLPKPKDREIASEAIRKVGIEELRKRPYTELSGGERQLVMIARVLAQEPKIILLDEPVSHLDLANQTKFLALIKKLVTAGMTVLAVLHDPNIAFLYGEEFLFAHQGSIRKPEGGEDPWDPKTLSEVYGIPIKVSRMENQLTVSACWEDESG
jgi:iron complex transport system ATP-binding protein